MIRNSAFASGGRFEDPPSDLRRGQEMHYEFKGQLDRWQGQGKSVFVV